MKILLLASGTVHSSLTHRGLSLGRELVKRGHTVTMFAPRYDKYSKFKLDMPAEIDGVTMQYPWQPKTPVFMLGLAISILSSALMTWRTQADLVYIFKPTPLTITGLLAKFRGHHVLADFDDLGQEVMLREQQPVIMAWLVGWCERQAARQANGLTVASRLLEHELSSTHPRTPLKRLTNGVNLADWTPRQPDRPAHIIFFGGLGRTSLLEPVLEALPAVATQFGRDRLIVDILGDGPARAQLETISASLGLANIVMFHGWTKPSDVHLYARTGDIALCIMPTDRATAACSNQKVFQYFALGLCVVATTVGDLPLYLDNGAAGRLVPPGNIPALSDALIQLLQNDEQRLRLASAGRQRVQAEYTWSHQANQLQNLIGEVTHG